MNCENIKEKLSLYIDNLLEPDESDKIREHIETCDSCRAYYNRLVRLGEMVDGFVISEKEEYWESQKDKVMEQIEQAESDKIIKVQPVKKRGSYYKYLAVAASLALVAFVSIYESQESNQLKGLFDDSEEITTEQLLEIDSAEDITVRGGRADKMSVETDVLSKEAEKTKSPDDLFQQNAIERTSVPKKRIEKSQAVTEREETIEVSGSPEAEQITPKPASLESSLELGKVEAVSTDDEYKTVFHSIEVSPQTAKVEPLSFEAPKSEVKKNIAKLPEARQKKVVENQGEHKFDNKKSAMSFESDEGKDYMPELRQEKDSTITEVNIYKIRLDSLEEKYAGIYSPHFRESSAKSRVGIRPDSLDTVILELAQTCFQVGILSLDEKEREDMIEKLRRLSINGSPESIEKIQRYIVLLLSAD